MNGGLFEPRFALNINLENQKIKHLSAMAVREPNKSDASSITAISIEAWIGTYLKHGVNAFFADYALEEFTPLKIEKLIADPNQFILVSDNEEGIDGFIRVSSSSTAPVADCSEIEILTFYVQPRHHGKGIGKRLLSAAQHHYRNQNANSVWLTPNAENDPAIASWTAHRGAAGHRPHGHGTDR